MLEVIIKRFEQPDEVRVLEGTVAVSFDDRVIALRAGELFHIPAVPHDSWVVGREPYVSLHFMGAERYATTTA